MGAAASGCLRAAHAARPDVDVDDASDEETYETEFERRAREGQDARRATHAHASAQRAAARRADADREASRAAAEADAAWDELGGQTGTSGDAPLEVVDEPPASAISEALDACLAQAELEHHGAVTLEGFKVLVRSVFPAADEFLMHRCFAMLAFHGSQATASTGAANVAGTVELARRVAEARSATKVPMEPLLDALSACVKVEASRAAFAFALVDTDLTGAVAQADLAAFLQQMRSTLSQDEVQDPDVIARELAARCADANHSGLDRHASLTLVEFMLLVRRHARNFEKLQPLLILYDSLCAFKQLARAEMADRGIQVSDIVPPWAPLAIRRRLEAAAARQPSPNERRGMRKKTLSHIWQSLEAQAGGGQPSTRQPHALGRRAPGGRQVPPQSSSQAAKRPGLVRRASRRFLEAVGVRDRRKLEADGATQRHAARRDGGAGRAAGRPGRPGLMRRLSRRFFGGEGDGAPGPPGRPTVAFDGAIDGTDKRQTHGHGRGTERASARKYQRTQQANKPHGARMAGDDDARDTHAMGEKRARPGLMRRMSRRFVEGFRSGRQSNR